MNRPLDPSSDAARTSHEVRAIASLDLEGLRRYWRDRWGEPPAYRSRDHLHRAAAYRLQTEVFGDLAPSARRKLADYADRFTQDRRFTPTPGPALKPGSSLIREWRGARHEVAVTADGFQYQGERFTSLSQVAFRITGTKWNGLVFFGLKARGGRS
jgi:hypothetical protein